MKLSGIFRIKSSELKEGEDGIAITTKMSGPWSEGQFSEYNKKLEEFCAEDFWKSMNTQQQKGVWLMHMSNAQSGEEFLCLNDCVIKNISLTSVNEDLIVTSLKIAHKNSSDQQALESVISTEVLIALEPDMSVLGEDLDPADQEGVEDTSGQLPPDSTPVLEEEPVLGEDTHSDNEIVLDNTAPIDARPPERKETLDTEDTAGDLSGSV